MFQQKSFSVQVKAGPNDGLDEGQFQAYASVFSNVDSYGDVVVKGAFADTLKEWNDGDSSLPLLWGHNMEDPDYNIGHITKAVEDDHGLLVTAQLDMEAPKAKQVYRLLKGRRVNQMSFAFDVLDSQHVKADPAYDESPEVNELRKLHLYEVSVVPIGANQATEVLAVKAAAQKAKEAAEAANEEKAELSADDLTKIREAVGALSAALDQLKDSLPVEDDDSDDGEGEDGPPAGLNDDGTKATANPSANDEEPSGAKSEEPTGCSPADVRLRAELIRLGA